MSLSPQDGAVNVVAFYEMSRNGLAPGTTGAGLVADMVAYGFVTAQTTCQTGFLADQTLSVECRDDGTGALVRGSTACQTCLSEVAAWQAEREALEVKAHQRNPDYHMQSWSRASRLAVEGEVGEKYATGACRYVCNQCVAEDITQNFQMKVDASCQADQTPNFVRAFTQGVQLKAHELVQRHQQGYHQVTGGPPPNLSNDDYNSQVSQSIAAQLTQSFNVKMLNQLVTQAVQLQTISVSPESTSLVLARVEQHVSATVISKAVLNLMNTAQAFGKDGNQTFDTSLDYQSQISKLKLNKKVNDLLKDLTATVKNLQDLLRSTIGQIFASLLALLLLAVLACSLLIYFRRDLPWLFGPDVSAQDEEKADRLENEGRVVVDEDG